MENLNFRFNSTILLVGSSNSGKTAVIKKFVTHADELLDKPPHAIVICHAEGHGKQFQSLLKDKRVKIHEGLPDDWSDVNDENKRTILVLDDVLDDIGIDKLTNLVCVSAHHCQLVLMITLHNLFHDKIRTVRINSTYLFLMKNPQDRLAIRRLATQLLPGQSKFLVSAYEDATKEPFSYFLIDNHQLTPDNLRYRSNVLFEDPKRGISIYNPIDNDI